MALQKLIAGESRLSDIKADTFNACVDAAKIIQDATKRNGFDSQIGVRQSGYVLIQNQAGSVQPFQPMWCSSATRPGIAETVALADDSNTHAFNGPDKSGLVFQCDNGKVGTEGLVVPVEPIPTNGLGWGVASGLVTCWVFIDQLTHGFADFDTTTQGATPHPCLKSAATGCAQILSRISEADVGEVKLCMIRIGNEDALQLRPFMLVDDLHEGVTTATARVAEMTVVPSGGMTAPQPWYTTEEVELSPAKGWTGYASGRDPDGPDGSADYFYPARGGDVVFGYYDRQDDKYYAVGAGQFFIEGTYVTGGYIRCKWRSNWEFRNLPVSILEMGDTPEDGDKIVAWYRHGGWKALAAGQLEATGGCGVEISEEGEISVYLPEIINEESGLEVIDGATEEDCKTLAIKTHCHITRDANGISVNVESILAADSGLEVVGEDCKQIRLKLGCGVAIDETGAVTIDFETIVGPGLSYTGCQISVDLDIGCGLTGSGHSVAFNAVAVASDGLQVDGPCGIKVKGFCNITVNGSGVSVDVDALLAEDSGLETVDGDCKTLRVKLGCFMAIDDDGGLTIDLESLLGEESGLEIIPGAGDACDTLAVKTTCGIGKGPDGLYVDLNVLVSNGNNVSGLKVFAAEGEDPCNFIGVQVDDTTIEINASGDVAVKWSPTFNEYTILVAEDFTDPCDPVFTYGTLRVPDNVPITVV